MTSSVVGDMDRRPNRGELAQRYSRLIALAALAIVSLVGAIRAGRLEYLLLDLRFAVSRLPPAARVPAAVVLFRVTGQTERVVGSAYGPSWRRLYPEAIERLAAAGARAVVWDAVFAAADEADDDLARALARLPVIAGESSEQTTATALRDAFAALGWLEVEAVEGVPRRALASPGRPALGSLAAAYAAADGLGDVGSAAADERWIDYSDDPLEVLSFDLAALLGASDERLADEARTPLSAVSGRLVFIGVDLEGVDRFRLPGSAGRTVAGVYAHIASYRTYAARDAITPFGPVAGALVSFALAASALAGATSRRRTVRRVTPALVAVVVLFVPVALFVALRVWLPQGDLLVGSLLALGLAGAVRRVELARSYRESLGFAPELIERHAAEVGTGGTGIERHAAVLCADVRGYTQLVSDHDSALVYRVMSRYMREMEEIIEAHDGYVNKYVGDEIVAVFGFPRGETGSAERAVEAAGRMLERVVELRAEWKEAGLPAIVGIGIGIDEGPLRFLRIGGRRRAQFDVIGAPVNGASRFQALTKEHRTPLVVSDRVAETQSTFELDSPSPDGAAFRFIGEVLVRGQGRRRLCSLHDPTLSTCPE